MKTRLLFTAMILLLSIQFTNAQTVLYDGPVSGKWSFNESPYIIRGSIYVEDQTSLEIEAGVQVIFQTSDPFMIYGQLTAKGNLTDSILFSTDRPERGWGGLRFEQKYNPNDTSVIKYCRFEYASAQGNWPYHAGGAIGIKYTNSVSISNSLFQNNQAMQEGREPGAGGAIAIWLSDVRITNCVFRYNKAQYGGAIFISKYSKAIVDNSLFHHNKASMNGGAIEVSDFAEPTLINLTLANNDAVHNGGALDIVGGGNPTLLNCILFDNRARAEGDQISLASNDTDVHLRYSTIEGGTKGISNYHSHSLNQIFITDNPQFIQDGNMAYQLSTYSPVIDAGSTNPIYLPEGFEFTNFDMAGNDRITGNSIDMGYLETRVEMQLQLLSGEAETNEIYSDWTIHQQTGNKNDLNDVFFTNETNGYAVGEKGTILMTNNGGLNWHEVRVGGHIDFQAVYFTTNEIGYAVGNTTDGPFVSGIIYATNNGGKTWKPVFVGREEMLLEDITFTTTKKGFATGKKTGSQGETSLLLTTKNAGGTWSEIENSPILKSINSIHFVDENLGFLTGTMNIGPVESSVVMKTENGARSWDLVYSETGQQNFSEAFFSKEGDGLIIGENGAIIRTEDNGRTWSEINLSSSDLNGIIAMKNYETVVVGDNGSIYSTADAGNTWTMEVFGSNNNLNKITVTKGGTFWVVGDQGTILSREIKMTEDSENLDTKGSEKLTNDVEFSLNPISSAKNYPNPFKGKTTISWELVQPAMVNISVYGMNGKLLEVLENRNLETGSHTVEFNSDWLAPGMYFFVISSGQFVEKGKMIVTR